MNKKGDGWWSEIQNVVLILVLLAICVGAALYLYYKGGGQILETVKNWLRFGG